MTTLSFEQIETLWDQAGGNPGWAPLAAGVAEAESGGNTGALNNDPGTGDYSVGLWQINYYGDLLGPRTQEYGSPSSLQADPAAQARAAVELSGNGADWQPWETDRAWEQWQAAGTPQMPSASTVQGWLQNAGVPTGGAALPPGDNPAPSSSSSATTTGLNLNPFDLFGIPSTVIGGATASAESWIGRALLVVTGLGIIALGVWKTANPNPKLRQAASALPDVLPEAAAA